MAKIPDDLFNEMVDCIDDCALNGEDAVEYVLAVLTENSIITTNDLTHSWCGKWYKDQPARETENG